MSRYKSVIGAAGLIMGIIALIYASIYPAATNVIAGLALLSLVMLVWFLAASFRTLKSVARKQSTILRINNALMLIFFIVIVLLVNLIIRQYYYRADLSSTRRYTLAPQSISVARMVDKTVEIMFFATEGSKEAKRVRDLMEMYRYENRRITYSFYDLDRVPLKAKEFNVVEYNTLVFRSGEQVLSAKGSDEEALTNLLIRGTRRKVINVRYMLGHNERSVSDTDRDGYGKVLGQLRAQGYNVQPLDLRGEELGRSETDLVIIASPRSELSAAEYDKLWQYREAGGKLLLLVDGPNQLVPLLKSFAVKVSDAPLYDRKNVAGTDPSTPLVDSYPNSPITKNFGVSTVFPGVHALHYNDRVMLGFVFTPMVHGSPENWLESNNNRRRDAGEETHPQTIAAIVSHPDKLVKAVIFGDSDFASNAYLGVSGNANLFVNSVNWLCGEGAMVSVAPQKSTFVPMFVSDQQSRLLRILVPVGIPAFFIMFGAWMWLRRRRL